MVLELNQVQKKFGEFELNCSLNVKKGYVTGLIGQNGAGKSTAFKAALGLIEPDRGEISLFGKKVKDFDGALRERTGIVLSDSGFSNYLDIYDISAIMKKFYKDFDIKDFKQTCKKANLPLDRRIKEFSTGMKAKLKVLLAVSHQADFLLLDEPTAGLDVVARDEILDLLRSYIRRTEASVLISSHISSDLEGFCDDIYMIDQGNIILHEDTDVILDQYGVIKATQEQMKVLDRSGILRMKEENYGYACLTNNKEKYLSRENGLIIEKGTIDEVITMMIKGEKL